MSSLVTMAAALLFPFVAMVLVLWLAHLEETLPGAVQAARRDPVPAPILAIAVGPEPAEVATGVGPEPAEIASEEAPAVLVTEPVHQIAV